MGHRCSAPFSTISNSGRLSVTWLDGNVNKTTKNLEIQHRLRTVVELLSIFENVNQCEQHIRQTPLLDRTILIISNSLGQELIPRIHEVQQLTSIYVFYENKQTNNSWATRYTKVKKCF